jgi:hypothetical protein
MNDVTGYLVRSALADVGVKETSPNDSPEIAAWRARIGKDLPPGAWCAVFAWCKMDDTLRRFGVANPIKGTRSVHKLFQRAKAAGLWTATPGPGMIFGVDHGGGLGHCGIIIELGQNEDATTVEGNSNAAGSRDADRVALRDGNRRRLLSTCELGYIDPGLALLAAQAERA